MRRIALVMALPLAVIVVLSGTPAALGQEAPAREAAPPTPSRDRITLHSRSKELRQGENLAILFGNVRVVRGKFEVLADAVVAWFKEGSLEVREIYAEGSVLMTDGRDIVSAEALYYNFDTERATIIDAWVQTTQKALGDLTGAQRSKESGPPSDAREPVIGLSFRARKVRTERPTRYIADDLTLSTCMFAVAHWGVRSRKAVVYPGGTFEATRNSIFIGPVRIPLFNVRFEPDWRMPLYSFKVGSSSETGDFTLSRWQLVIQRDLKLFCDFDRYRKRGSGRGGLVEYTGRDPSYPYSGYFEAYEIKDRMEPAGERDRHRLKFLHIQSLPAEVNMALEYSRATDPDFIKEFFEREYKKGRPQETYAYFRRIYRNMGLRLLASTRTEDFRTSTLRQPQLRADVIGRELPGGFYLSSALRNEKVLRQYAKTLALPDEEAERHDVFLRLTRPVAARGFFNLLPGLNTRYTHYNRNGADSENVDREVVTLTCSADTQLSRIYRTKCAWLNIDGLKHVIEPELVYENTYHCDSDPSTLFQFDEVDSIRRCERFTLSLTNRLDTRRVVHKRLGVVNLLDWRLQIPYYPRPKRDNGGESYGPLESHLEVSISPFLSIRTDLAYDTAWRHMAKGSANITAGKPNLWQVYLGGLYLADEDNIGTLGFCANLSPKWQASVRLQHNLTRGRYISKTFILTRRFHCWTMELGMVVERDKDSPTYTFLISPAALFKKESKLRFTEESTFVK